MTDRDLQNYREAIDFLLGRINYERVSTSEFSAGDFKLDRMRSLLGLIGDPHRELPAVHIAGTKGKGSTAMMTAAILTQAGYRVGLFTSPHISRLEERMTVNGRLPNEREVVELVDRLRGPLEEMNRSPQTAPPTYFEILTAMAWLYFRDQRVDIVVLEVGLGGRLDSTNLCCPEVTVITSISHDHTRLLGATLGLIAAEKAGILKSGVPLINGELGGEALTVIQRIAHDCGAPILQLGSDFRYQHHPAVNEENQPAILPGQVDVFVADYQYAGLPLPALGVHQAHNAALAVSACTALRERGWRISEQAIQRGMLTAKCPVRMELVCNNPLTIVDAAHNPASIRALAQTLDSTFSGRKKGLIFAVSRDKPGVEMLLELLPRFAWVVVTRYLNNPRGLPPEELIRAAQSHTGTPLHVAESPVEAWERAEQLADSTDLVCVTGSFFIAAEIRDLFLPERQSASKHSAPLKATPQHLSAEN